ncbi:sulfotransferase domain-containing protein [Desulfovulcanus sp.]
MELVYENDRIVLPDFFIVGAARSGTTSLYYYLKQHHDIFMPPNNKEPAFFVFMDRKYSPSGITTIESYEKIFEGSRKDQKIGEASTVYLYRHDIAIDKIKKLYGGMYSKLRALIILRNPVDRAYSHYLWAKREGLEDLAFENAIKQDVISTRLGSLKNGFVYDYIGYGMYYNQVKHYLDTFRLVKIILFDDLAKNTQKTIDSVFSFLGVSAIDVNLKIYNTAGIPCGLHSRLFYNFLWQENIVKLALKKATPKVLRRKISRKISDLKFSIANSILNKEPLPPILRTKLLDFYKEDLVRLCDLLDNNQKKIILKWIQNENRNMSLV